MRLLAARERTTPEQDGSAGENCKSRQGAGEKEHERCRSTLVAFAPQVVEAFIAFAAPGTTQEQ